MNQLSSMYSTFHSTYKIDLRLFLSAKTAFEKHQCKIISKFIASKIKETREVMLFAKKCFLST